MSKSNFIFTNEVYAHEIATRSRLCLFNILPLCSNQRAYGFLIKDANGNKFDQVFTQQEANQFMSVNGYKFSSECVCTDHPALSCVEDNNITCCNIFFPCCSTEEYGVKARTAQQIGFSVFVHDHYGGNIFACCLPADYEPCVPCKLLLCPRHCQSKLCVCRKFIKNTA